MRRKSWVVLVGVAIGIMLVAAGCANATSGGTSPSASSSETASEPSIDYGTSELYTQADMDAAIKIIMDEFSEWKGATMKTISFTDDATCANDVSYCNGLRRKEDPEFDQAIVFTTNFHSPSEADAAGTAWEPNADYNDYQWHLARTKGGEWKLLGWGY